MEIVESQCEILYFNLHVGILTGVSFIILLVLQWLEITYMQYKKIDLRNFLTVATRHFVIGRHVAFIVDTIVAAFDTVASSFLEEKSSCNC